MLTCVRGYLVVSSNTYNVISQVITDAAHDGGTWRPKVEDVKVGASGRIHDDVRAIGSQEVSCVRHCELVV